MYTKTKAFDAGPYILYMEYRSECIALKCAEIKYINRSVLLQLSFAVAEEPIWNLERRESSGHLFWCRDASKVKFRCDVEVLEYVKDPDEHKCYYDDNNNTTADKITNALVVCATCVAAIAVTVFLPWLLIGSS